MARIRNVLLNRAAIVIVALLALGIPVALAEPELSDAELIADVETIQPGTPFTAGVRITLQKGWHTYWRNPGDSGMAPRLAWRLPEGFTVGPIHWPAPQRFDEPPFATFGYADDVLFACEVQPPASLATGQDHTIEVKVSWLICKEVCLPRTRTLSVSLRAETGAPSPSAVNQSLFARARGQWPVADPTWAFRASTDAEAILLLVSPPPGISARTLMSAAFFPAQADLVRYGSLAWARSGDGYGLRLERAPTATLPTHLDGVLVLPPGGGRKGLALDIHAPLAEPEPSMLEGKPSVDRPQQGEAP